jgi:PPOX class probable F420-dependent enzyme
MSAVIPESHVDLLINPIPVTLVTVMPNGQPQASLVWCAWDGTHILINTARGRVKDKNMTARPMATVMVVDPQNSFRYLEARCAVDEITEEGAVALIDRLAWEYAGKTPYYGGFQSAEMAGQETRVTYKLKPTKVVAFGL